MLTPVMLNNNTKSEMVTSLRDHTLSLNQTVPPESSNTPLTNTTDSTLSLRNSVTPFTHKFTDTTVVVLLPAVTVDTDWDTTERKYIPS